MAQQVILPPNEPLDAQGLKSGGWWHADNDRIVCDLCPRRCSLKPGDRGFCFVRQNVNDQIKLTTYGRSTGFCIDPIEKKPLNHFYPGTSVLSFGTAGCNLGCKFCQNWDISKSREITRLSELAMPDDIVEAARSHDCHSVAFTYNDPVIWAEYAIDTARACREAGVKSVAVTAGYITPEARGPFYEYIDAVNVDLKAFSEEFYHHLTLSHLEPVLETLCWLQNETDVWFEITNLVIPDANDDPAELQKMCDWILENVGDEVPVHFTAFHPDYRMQDRGNTPHETLIFARETALKAGLKFVYAGNVSDLKRQSTYCPNCQELLIERNCYVLGEYHLDENHCSHCGQRIPGHFEKEPGSWGRRRQPVDMRKFQKTVHQLHLKESDKNASKPIAVKEGTIVGNPTANLNSTNDSADASSANQRIDLSEINCSALLAASSEHVSAAAQKRNPSLSDATIAGLAARPVAGAFVSLKRSGQLRACCGTFGQMMPLQQALAHAAHRSATSDPRFPPISPSELPSLQQEVWLLHAPEEVKAKGADRIASVTVGVHGLQIVRGDKRGLLLPGVPVDHHWDAEQFLNQTCVKAGLSPNDWKDDLTTLLRFEGQVVKGPLLEEASEIKNDVSQTLFKKNELDSYAEHARQTLTTLLSGATPLYYYSAVFDTELNGVAIMVGEKNQTPELTASLHSLQQKIPLQATIFSMCEQLARELSARKRPLRNLHVDFAVMFDPAVHGTVAKPDLTGFHPQTRGLFLMEQGNTGFEYDVNRSAQELFDQAVRATEIATPALAQVFSFAVQSTRNPLRIQTRRKPATGESIRPAAVAGRFYPNDLETMNREIDLLLEGSVPKAKYAAAMVPHAGWRYSGQIAANVLKRIELPKTIIIIGPKHTPHGVEWAVAPHQKWSLPGTTIESDTRLAHLLAENIPGLELDAAAHQQEHGIEVELPLIARLNPNSKVVGITIGRASLEQCHQFANSLAQVLTRLEEKPLLLISSDMNHFATDEENRRLDELALQQLDRIDPDALYQTTQEHKISMCGVRPAVIILKTLSQLNLLHESQRVGYATSADVSGDTSRVVGYAGMLFN